MSAGSPVSKRSLDRRNVCAEERADAGRDGILSLGFVASLGVHGDVGFGEDLVDDGRESARAEGGGEGTTEGRENDRAECGGEGTTDEPGDVRDIGGAKEDREEDNDDGTTELLSDELLPSTTEMSKTCGDRRERAAGGGDGAAEIGGEDGGVLETLLSHAD